MEKHIGDVKRVFPYPLPEAYAGDLPQAQGLLDAIRLEFNARPRPGLGDCSTTEMFYAGPHLRVDRATRHSIFGSLCQQTWLILHHVKTLHQHSFAAAWRKAAQSWLCCQALISVAINQEKRTNQRLLLPLFSEKWSH